MKKHIIFSFSIILFIVVNVIGIFCLMSNINNECTEDGYAEYKPIFFDTTARSKEEMYIIDESRVDADHFENVKFVLEYYKLEYKLVDNKIMIKCGLWKDKDSLTNITKKAGDRDWLATHREFRRKFPGHVVVPEFRTHDKSDKSDL